MMTQEKPTQSEVFDSDNTPFEFPCRVPIKVMGRDQSGFADKVLRIVEQHAEGVSKDDLRARSSSGGKFVSVTIEVTAQSRDQLEIIYQQLHASEDVLWTL